MFKTSNHRVFSLLFIVGIFVACGGPAAAYTFESVGLYQSFDEMQTWAAAFEAANPDLVSVVEFGRSHQDRPLLAIKLSTSPQQNDPAKPEFLFTGGVHAREVIGSEAAYRLAEHLVSSYRVGSSASIDILAEREVWIVPTLNPDGRIRVEGGYSQQRKNMELYAGQTSSTYTRGVDLNRNFPHRWSDASNVVRNETYRGPAPLSAPEATALWSLLHDQAYFSNMLAAIDFHSGAEAILAPWISPSDNQANPLPQEDSEKLDFITQSFSNLTGMSDERLGYDSYGTLVDSLYEEFGTYAICEELHTDRYWAGDYFRLFNPLDQPGIDNAVTMAIDSSMFLLSDQAFEIVPEPAAWLLITMLTATWLVTLRRRSL